jgi:hypothetical protein
MSWLPATRGKAMDLNETRRILMIEDHPSLKAHDKGLDLSTMTVAISVEDGISVFLFQHPECFTQWSWLCKKQQRGNTARDLHVYFIGNSRSSSMYPIQKEGFLLKSVRKIIWDPTQINPWNGSRPLTGYNWHQKKMPRPIIFSMP